MELDSANLRKGMEESEINAKLKNVSGYLGTFAINELEKLYICHYPSFVVVNLDERGNDGTHWIAVAMYQNDVYICDSLGTLLPSSDFPGKLVNFLYRVTFRRDLKITRQLQSLSSVSCGLFCTFFVTFMSTNNNFKDFLSKFSTNLELNDLIVRLYYKQTF